MSEKPKSKKVTYCAFNSEYGVQVVQPNGKFLKFIREAKENSSAESDYHIIGIKEVVPTTMGITVTLKSGVERIFPYSSISNFTLE